MNVHHYQDFTRTWGTNYSVEGIFCCQKLKLLMACYCMGNQQHSFFYMQISVSIGHQSPGK